MNGGVAARVVVQPQLVVVVVGQSVGWIVAPATTGSVVGCVDRRVWNVAVVVVATGVERLGQDDVVHGWWHRIGVVAGKTEDGKKYKWFKFIFISLT